MDRRDFLKYLGTIGVLATGSNWVTDKLWSRMKETRYNTELIGSPGLESWVTSICGLCPGGCGIRVRIIDGLPVKIKGNPLHPINRGGLCAAGHAGLQVLYNPDRIKGPIRRVGPSGSGHWEPLNMDEALKIVANKLINLRNSKQPHRLLFLDGGSRGVVRKIIGQFLTSYGTPNNVRMDDWDNRNLVYRFMHGCKDIPGYDISNTQLVLSFGADLLETEGSIVWFSRHLNSMRRKSGRNRGRLIHVSPRLSVTAVKSDKWIPIKPGTEGILALGIAYMMIQENLYDSDFVEKYTFGFEDWVDDDDNIHVGFMKLILEKYHPEYVTRMTGIPAEDIIFLARSFAEKQPSIAICGKSLAWQQNGFYTQLAVHSLNALVGNLGKPGGIITYTNSLLEKWPDIKLDETSSTGLDEPRIDLAGTISFPIARNVPSNLADQILAEKPYPINMLILYRSNPIFEIPEGEKWKKVLKKIPFVVSFSSFMDESSEFADIILPESTYLESWQADINVPYVYFDHYSVGQPVINPIGDSKHVVDYILNLGKRIGGPISRSLPFKDYFSIIRWIAEQVLKSGRGTIGKGEFHEAWTEYLENRGWCYLQYKNFDEFWEHLIEKGCWMDPVPKHLMFKPKFDTPSKKFEFYINGFEQELKTLANKKFHTLTNPRGFTPEKIAASLGIKASGDEIYLPHYEPIQYTGDEFEYPWDLSLFELDILGNGLASNSPMLLEMVGFRQYVRWDSWAEINPDTAIEIGVSDGDLVWVESSKGKVRVRVKIFAGAHPDRVYLPIGLGHKVFGQFAKNLGVNPNNLIVNKFDLITGVIARIGTKVKIYKDNA